MTEGVLRADRRVWFLMAASLCAGCLNGLLGTGGGMILLFALGRCLPKEQQKESFVIGSFGVLVFSLVSMVFYGQGGAFPAGELPRFALPAAAGGLLGAYLIRYVPTAFLRKLFGALLLFGGLKMTGVL